MMKRYNDMRTAKSVFATMLVIALLFADVGHVFSESATTPENEALGTVEIATATPQHTAEPTPIPTPEQTVVPTPEPTAIPTAIPTTEPTTEPTAETTAEPTNLPTVEPTTEPTAEPNATQTPTATLAPTITATHTSTPLVTPTATPWTGNNVAEMPGVSNGYLRLLGRASAHETARSADDSIGVLNKGAIIYAVERPYAGEKTDRLLTAFNVEGHVVTAYIDAQELYPLTDIEIDLLREENKRLASAEQVYYDAQHTIALPLVTFTPEETDSAPFVPDADPTPTLIPTETPSPTATATPLSTASLVDSTKEVGAGDIGKMLANKNMQDTQALLGGKADVIYEEYVTNLQSSHDYANNTNQMWGYRVENAARITVTFSTDTYVENGFDYIIIYDAGGNYYAQFTGSALAGRSVTVRGDCMYVRLISNNSVTGYGFSAVSANPYTQPTLSSCYATGSATGVQLRWAFYSFIDGYYIYRATTTQTGRTGAFTYLASVAGSQSAYMDNTAVPGSINSYKILAYTRVSGVQYRTNMSAILNMSPVGKTTITAVTPIGSDSVLVGWNPVSGANRYVLYASDSVNGTYTQIGTSPDGATTYTVSGLGSSMYFFKVRAVTQIDASTYMGPYSDAMVGLLGFTAPSITGTHSPSASALTVNWSAVTGASGYQLFRASAAAGPYSTYVGYFTGTSYTDTTIPTGVYSFYRVRAVLKNGSQTHYSALSPYCSGYPLAVPSNVVASWVSGTTARLTWNGVANTTHYDIYTSIDGSSFTLQTTLSSSVRSYDMSFDASAMMGYFKIRAVRVGGTKRFTSNMSGIRSVPLSQPNNTTYRALAIGQLYRGTTSQLYGTDLDASSIRLMLGTMTGTPFTTVVREELTASGILSSITSAFAGADSDDVSLFFYSGHGLLTASSEYLGSLCGVNASTTNDYVTPTMLRNRLDTIPGKKIVFINACHSGNMIGKDAQGDSVAFTNAFIKTFSSGGKSNLASNDYYVLVAASSSESGYMIYQNGIWAGVFTRGVCMGSGWNELGGYSTSMNADSNANRNITLNELYHYVVQYVRNLGVSQTTQVYPDNSNYVLYGRTE